VRIRFSARVRLGGAEACVRIGGLKVIGNYDINDDNDESPPGGPDPHPSMLFGLAVAAALPLSVACYSRVMLSWNAFSVISIKPSPLSNLVGMLRKDSFVQEGSAGFMLRRGIDGRMLRAGNSEGRVNPGWKATRC
jgi:hypothetical protein